MPQTCVYVIDSQQGVRNLLNSAADGLVVVRPGEGVNGFQILPRQGGSPHTHTHTADSQTGQNLLGLKQFCLRTSFSGFASSL